jgi:hypothetical protein
MTRRNKVYLYLQRLKLKANRPFYRRDIEFSKNIRLEQTCHKNRVYLKIQYLDKGTFFLAETLKGSQIYLWTKF